MNTQKSNIQKYQERQLRNIQEKELHILCAIHDICRRHGIDYWLDGGTLLGAVRHKGFIPWDDDIDIAMRKEDFPKFAEYAAKELPEGLFLQTPQTDASCRLPLIKVRDTNSFIVEYGDDFTRPYQKGLFVDIFPFIPYPNVSKKFCKQIIKEYCRSNAILHQQHTYSLRSFAEFFWFGAKKLSYLLVWKAACLLLRKDIAFANTIETNGYGIKHNASDIFPISEISFEGKMFCAPANPDNYLKSLFNDYMTLPPIEKRTGHAVFYIANLINE